MALAGLAASLRAQPDIHEIIRRSVAANEADWKRAPEWAFQERDVITKGGTRTVRTYEVLMLDGSDYQRRLHESERARSRRIAKYQRERQQDHAMMREMMKAFDFHLQGEGQMNGRQVYIVQALPNPGYQPPNRDTRVLTGMMGSLWIDQQTYQWVKVEAEVVQPVSGDLWLPTRFEMRVNASILWIEHNSTDDETYRNYRPMDVVARQMPGAVVAGPPALRNSGGRQWITLRARDPGEHMTLPRQSPDAGTLSKNGRAGFSPRGTSVPPLARWRG